MYTINDTITWGSADRGWINAELISQRSAVILWKPNPRRMMQEVASEQQQHGQIKRCV